MNIIRNAEDVRIVLTDHSVLIIVDGRPQWQVRRAGRVEIVGDDAPKAQLSTSLPEPPSDGIHRTSGTNFCKPAEPSEPNESCWRTSGGGRQVP